MTSPVRAPRPTPRRIAEPAPRRDHLRMVPTGADAVPRRRRMPAVLAVAMVLVFGSLLVSAVLHGLLVSGQSHLDRVDAEVESTRAELAREKLELANLQSPGRIAEEAEKLGMVPASEQIWLSPGTGDAPVVTGSTPPPDPEADPETGAVTDADTTTETESETESDLAVEASDTPTGAGVQ